MNELNKYGIVSDGCLFDHMDRAAQFMASSLNPKLFWLTKTAKVKFIRQCCSTKKLQIGIKKTFGFLNKATFKAFVFDKNDNIVAEAKFRFVAKKKLHCKGVKNGRTSRR